MELTIDPHASIHAAGPVTIELPAYMRVLAPKELEVARVAENRADLIFAAGRHPSGDIVFISSDLDEVLQYSDRVLVFYAGKVSPPLEAQGLTVEALGRLIGGKGWDELGLTQRLVALQQQAYRPRGFGDFWQHMLVAEGALDAAVDAVGLEPYDIAAVKVVVEQAGGVLTDRLGVNTHEHNSAVSSNGRLHAAVISALRP